MTREIPTRIRRLRTHGGEKMYRHDEVGMNSRLDALQAAGDANAKVNLDIGPMPVLDN